MGGKSVVEGKDKGRQRDAGRDERERISKLNRRDGQEGGSTTKGRKRAG